MKPHDVIRQALGERDNQGWMPLVIDALDKAGFVIVPRASEDRVTAACRAYATEPNYTVSVSAMRLALAAADAAALRLDGAANTLLSAQ